MENKIIDGKKLLKWVTEKGENNAQYTKDERYTLSHKWLKSVINVCELKEYSQENKFIKIIYVIICLLFLALGFGAGYTHPDNHKYDPHMQFEYDELLYHSEYITQNFCDKDAVVKYFLEVNK